MKLPRFFSTRNKICICHPLSILWLCIFSLLVLYILRQDAASKLGSEVSRLQPPDPRIFCVIMTFEYRHNVAFSAYRSWVKQCDNYIFVSDDSHELLEPAVFQNLPDKWLRMRAHMDYIYRYHMKDGDWFLFANDDNFVIVENLKLMVKAYSSDELIYFGCKLKTSQGQAYMYDRSSMILSRSVLKRFALDALTNKKLCSTEKLGDDAYLEFGRCLSSINVVAGDSRDKNLLHRFLPFETEVHLGASPLNISLESHKKFVERAYDKVEDLRLPVSPFFISCHMNDMSRAHDLYYLTYRVKNFGLPRKILNYEERLRK